MTLLPRLTLALCLLAPLPGVAETAPPTPEAAATRSAAEQKALRGFILLDHEKQITLIKKLGLPSEGAFYDCVCRTAGYGSSSTHQFYHPAGIPNSSPSCETGGDPCIVAGFGCMRYPPPRDVAILEACARETAGPEGGILDALLKTAREQVGKTAPDYAKDLKECRATFDAGLNRDWDARWTRGVEYLAATGVPVLEPPKEIAGKLVQGAVDAQRVAAEKWLEGQKKAEQAAADKWLEKYRDEVLLNAETYQTAASLAEDTAKVFVLDMDFKIKGLEAELSGLLAKTDRSKDSVRILDLNEDLLAARRTREGFLRDQAALKSFASGADVLASLLAAKDIKEKLESGKVDETIGGLKDGFDLAKKYVDKLKDSQGEIADTLKEAARRGVSTAEYDKLVQTSARVEVLKGASDALGKTVKVGKMAVWAIKQAQDIRKLMDQAEAEAKSGQFTKAQQNLRAALRAMDHVAKSTAEFLPPGFAEVTQYYGEALGMAVVLEDRFRAMADRAGEMVDLSGSQEFTKAMKAFNAKYGGYNLRHEGYLRDVAGLSVYEILEGSGAQAKIDKPYVLMPKADGQPIYADAAAIRRLAELAYIMPLATGKRLTDADIYDIFVGGDGTKLALEMVKKDLDKTLEEAARKKRIADMLGEMPLSDAGLKDWYAFNALMTKVLPKGCALPVDRVKRLLGEFRDPAQRDAVIDKLTDYGAKLQAAAADQAKEGAKP